MKIKLNQQKYAKNARSHAIEQDRKIEEDDETDSNGSAIKVKRDMDTETEEEEDNNKHRKDTIENNSYKIDGQSLPMARSITPDSLRHIEEDSGEEESDVDPTHKKYHYNHYSNE